jgi:hypothetical protein
VRTVSGCLFAPEPSFGNPGLGRPSLLTGMLFDFPVAPPKRCVLPVRPGNYSHSESAYPVSMSAGRRVLRCSRHKACVTSDRLGRIRGMSSCFTCSRCRRVARERWSISILVSCAPSKWNAEDREGCMVGSVRKILHLSPVTGSPNFVSNSCRRVYKLLTSC